MKTDTKRGIISITLILIAFFILLMFLPEQEFTLQYLEDGELKTEIVNSTKEWNERANELRSQGLKVYKP